MVFYIYTLNHFNGLHLNHFNYIFVYGVRECSNFIVSHVAVQLSHHHLLTVFSLLHILASFFID